MIITLPRAALAAALGQVQKVVERRNTIPILSNVCLTADKEGLTLTATDLDIEITTRIEGAATRPGAVTAPAHLLTDIIRKMPEKADVTLELTEDGNGLRVSAGRARMDLLVLPASDYPNLTLGEFPHRFTLASTSLQRMLDKTAFAISTEETRYYLNGIYFHVRREQLLAVATDGHRLARIALPAPEAGLDFPGIIIPRKTVERLTAMAEAAPGDWTIEISETKIRVTAGATVLVSKLIDGTFPDYDRVIPRGNDKLMTTERKALAGAVDRVSTVASERGRAVKLSLEPGRLLLKVVNADSGTGEETMDVDYDGEPVEIGFNSKYVGDALAAIGSDKVTLAIDNPGAPALLTNPQDGDFFVVLMPMRV